MQQNERKKRSAREQRACAVDSEEAAAPGGFPTRRSGERTGCTFALHSSLSPPLFSVSSRAIRIEAKNTVFIFKEGPGNCVINYGFYPTSLHPPPLRLPPRFFLRFWNRDRKARTPRARLRSFGSVPRAVKCTGEVCPYRFSTTAPKCSSASRDRDPRSLVDETARENEK